MGNYTSTIGYALRHRYQNCTILRKFVKEKNGLNFEDIQSIIGEHPMQAAVQLRIHSSGPDMFI